MAVKPFGKAITIATANSMISNYVDHVKRLQTEPKKKTEYVIFSLPELMAWLKQIEPYSDELKICLGVHPQDASDPGRLTLILWPQKGGKPATEPVSEGKDGGGSGGINPYNDGNSGP